ncbi:hypothetical protein [Halobacteriovorax sp.]|uniref:hypothetical protein n=1 Tax=Halobacteriovorax sp. TaxID=2020862 RepID=UPI0035649D09
MKSVLLSLSFTFTVLLTMTSCQSQGSRSLRNLEDVRSEIIFKSDARLEMEVARVVKTASQTQSVEFFEPIMN